MSTIPDRWCPPVEMPSAFSISAPRDCTDYSMSARDMAVAVKIAWKQNGIVKSTVTGKDLMTGWRPTAALSVTIFVSSPLNQEAALKAVRDMAREIHGETTRAYLNASEIVRPIATGIPCGFRLVNAPQIVQRKRPRHCGYIGDLIGNVKDAWTRTESAFDAYCAANPIAAQ